MIQIDKRVININAQVNIKNMRMNGDTNIEIYLTIINYTGIGIYAGAKIITNKIIIRTTIGDANTTTLGIAIIITITAKGLHLWLEQQQWLKK